MPVPPIRPVSPFTQAVIDDVCICCCLIQIVTTLGPRRICSLCKELHCGVNGCFVRLYLDADL